MLTVGSLFSGIGGLDLGLERAGMRVRWQCESDPYCRAVLRKHWPNVPLYKDVKTLFPHTVIGADIRGLPQSSQRSMAEGHGSGNGGVAPVDLLCGGFPCQPVSYAGKRLAQEDVRWLWPHYARLIRLLRPLYVVVENVPGLRTAGMGDVLGDLARLGYDAEWESLPAAAFGAPHLRDRVWLVAYRDGSGGGTKHGLKQTDRAAVPDASSARELADASGERRGEESGQFGGLGIEERRSTITYPERVGLEGIFETWPAQGAAERDGSWWQSEPDVGRVAHGVPSRVDRLRALGNAVVPQVAEYIGRQIVTAHNRRAA